VHAPGAAARAARDGLEDGALVQVAGDGGQVVVAAGLVGAQRVELAGADQRREGDRRQLGPGARVQRPRAQLAQQRGRRGGVLERAEDQHVDGSSGQ